MEKEIIEIIKVISKGKKFIVTTDIDDSEYTFTENQIVIYRIIKGRQFTKEEWTKIIEEQNSSLLFDKMLHYIDYKLRTEKEIRLKLQEKKASIEDIDNIVDRLKNIGYINDLRYVEIYVREQVRDYKGPYYIKFNLEQKGINTNLINEELLKYPTDLFEELALELTNKYQKTISNYPANKQKELIMQKLARNGYYMDIINRVIKSVTFGEDNLEKLENEYEKIYSRTNDVNKTITSLIQKGYRYEDIKKVKTHKGSVNK